MKKKAKRLKLGGDSKPEIDAAQLEQVIGGAGSNIDPSGTPKPPQISMADHSSS